MRERTLLLGTAILVTVFVARMALAGRDDRKDSPVIPQIAAVPPTFSDSTVPLTNGDVNPYGVAFVPPEFPHGGLLHPGDIIVANFNNAATQANPAGLQATGTTIVRVNRNGAPSVFFTSQAIGLSTALDVLKKGFVIVGNVPSIPSSPNTPLGTCNVLGDVGQGSLQVIDRKGNLVKTLTSATLFDGPWDMTVKDDGRHVQVFVSNVLTGTVTRLDLRITGDGDADKHDAIVVEKETQIASGYLHRCDPAAFVVGPTGLALDEDRDILYVSSTGDNQIFAIDDAGDRKTDAGMGRLAVSDEKHLHGPLALALARNGDLISSQGDAVNPDAAHPSEIVEFTPDGQFVAEFSIDPAPGSAFGLALKSFEGGFIFAAVDDGLNVLDIWVVR
ncbi:MAG: hypothetical protein WAR24_23435 [Candidatus Acidiferrales bacterium]